MSSKFIFLMLTAFLLVQGSFGTETTSSTEVSETTEPIETTEPLVTTESTETTEPNETTESTETKESTETTEPTETTKPTETTESTETTEPIETTESTETTESNETTEPNETTEATETTEPISPEEEAFYREQDLLRETLLQTNFGSLKLQNALKRAVAQLKRNKNSDIQKNVDVLKLQKLTEQLANATKQSQKLFGSLYAPINDLNNFLDFAELPKATNGEEFNEESSTVLTLEGLREYYSKSIFEFFEDFYRDGFLVWNAMNSKQQIDSKDFYVWFLSLKKEQLLEEKFRLLLNGFDKVNV